MNQSDKYKPARFVKKMDGWRGDAALYELSEPLDGYSKVVVSAAYPMFSGPETLIFAWDEEKNRVTSFSELDGSFRGEMSHKTALANAGYYIEGA